MAECQPTSPSPPQTHPTQPFHATSSHMHSLQWQQHSLPFVLDDCGLHNAAQLVRGKGSSNLCRHTASLPSYGNKEEDGRRSKGKTRPMELEHELADKIRLLATRQSLRKISSAVPTQSRTKNASSHARVIVRNPSSLHRHSLRPAILPGMMNQGIRHQRGKPDVPPLCDTCLLPGRSVPILSSSFPSRGINKSHESTSLGACLSTPPQPV